MEKFGRMQRNTFRLWKCRNIKHKQLFVPGVALGIRAAGSGWPGGKHCSDSLWATAGLRKHIDFTTTSDFPKFYLLTSTREALEDCHINICFERKCRNKQNKTTLTNSPTPTRKPCLRLFCLRQLTFSFKAQQTIANPVCSPTPAAFPLGNTSCIDRINTLDSSQQHGAHTQASRHARDPQAYKTPRIELHFGKSFSLEAQFWRVLLINSTPVRDSVQNSPAAHMEEILAHFPCFFSRFLPTSEITEGESVAPLTLRPADGAGQQETPSGSSTGSTEALLVLVILSLHDPARGRWQQRDPPGLRSLRGRAGAALSPRGAPGPALFPQGAPAAQLRAVPSGSSCPAPRCSRSDLSAPLCPLRDLSAPRRPPRRSRRPAPRLRSAHDAIRVPAAMATVAELKAGRGRGWRRDCGWGRGCLGSPGGQERGSASRGHPDGSQSCRGRTEDPRPLALPLVPWRFPPSPGAAPVMYRGLCTSVYFSIGAVTSYSLNCQNVCLRLKKKKLKKYLWLFEGWILSGTCLAWWVLARAQVPIPYRCGTGIRHNSVCIRAN